MRGNDSYFSQKDAYLKLYRGKEPVNEFADVRKFELGNGLRVRFFPFPKLHYGEVRLFFACGSRYETRENNGITHFLEHMMFQGTKRYASFKEIKEAAEDIGGTINACTGGGYVQFVITSHAAYLHRAMAILADVIFNPAFRDMEKERSVIEAEMLNCYDSKGRLVGEDLEHQLLFKRQPAALPIIGHPKVIKRVDVAALEEWRKKFFTAKNAVLAVAGPFSLGAVKKMAEQFFGKLPSGEKAKYVPARPVIKDMQMYLRRKASSHALINLILPMEELSLQDECALRVLASLLQELMNEEFRYSNGVAYNFGVNAKVAMDYAFLRLHVSLKPENFSKGLETLLDVMEKARRFRNMDRRFRRLRRRARLTREIAADFPFGVNETYGIYCLLEMEKEIMSVQQIFKRLSLSKIKELCRRLFTKPKILAMLGGRVKSAQKLEAEKMLRARLRL